MPLAIDPATAQMGAQKVVDSLTCQGVGGIVSAALGFASTSPSEIKILEAAMGQSGIPLDPTILQILPKGPITVTSEGNNFEVVLENRSIKINGQILTQFATLTALHGKCALCCTCFANKWLTINSSVVYEPRFSYLPAAICYIRSSLAFFRHRRLPG